LIGSWRQTTRVNENISSVYMFYQLILLLSSIIGPGTIFLVMVGALQLALDKFVKLSFFESFIINLVPVLIFTLLCFRAKADKQV
jgi:chitin synthase